MRIAQSAFSRPGPVSRVGGWMLAYFISQLILAGAGLMMLAVVMSRGYLGQPPRGDRGMMLVVPMLGILAGGLIFLFLAVAFGLRKAPNALHLVHGSGLVRAGIASALVIGITLGAFSCLMAWANQPVTSSVNAGFALAMQWCGGLIGPALLTLGILIVARMAPETLSGNPALKRAGGVLLASIGVLALTGYAHVAVDIAGAVSHHRRYANVGLIHQLMPKEYVRQRMAGTTTNNVAKELPQLGPDAPLWNVTALLVRLPNESEISPVDSQTVVDRAAQCDGIDAQMLATLMHEQPLLRRGAMRLIALAPAKVVAEHAAEWSQALVLAIEATTNEMQGRGDWAKPHEGNADPAGYLQDVLAAAQRLRTVKPSGQMDDALAGLNRAAQALQPGAERQAILDRLAKTGVR